MTEKWLVGVDLGGTTTKLAFINLYGEIIEKWEITTDTSKEGKNIVTNIAKSIDEQLEFLGHPKGGVLGVGMGAPGPVNLETGIIYGAVNLGWKEEYPLQNIMEAETSLPVIIDNDANCAALGEMWKGAGNEAKDLVCVTLGTGVGGGIITNGSIVHGKSGAAGEIGHITSVPNGGFKCNCGKTGCLETVASATGIVRIAAQAIQSSNRETELAAIFKRNNKVSAKDIFDLARKHDQDALRVIEEVAFHLGLALANLANTLNPNSIIIGGGVSKAGNLLLDRVRMNFLKFAFPRVAKSTELGLATLGNDAGVIGAAWLVKNKLSL
ncbi:ROK family glucokinase [Mesobacillus harenae]|uniref:ROK family glucokinase n=1 Tax=Mesobacillus harenae TaxID=2213203 RepID=UPI00157FD2CB|nr:ROK family glucokinase [Mesobacillus harenae]